MGVACSFMNLVKIIKNTSECDFYLEKNSTKYHYHYMYACITYPTFYSVCLLWEYLLLGPKIRENTSIC